MRTRLPEITNIAAMVIGAGFEKAAPMASGGVRPTSKEQRRPGSSGHVGWIALDDEGHEERCQKEKRRRQAS